MDIQDFITEFKKTFVYDLLSQTLSDEQLFEHVVDSDAVLWFKEQTRQMWLMWEKAKAQSVPKWVSVEDRLPPCDFEFCETGEHVSNVVLIHNAATYGFNMGMGHVNEDGGWNAYSCEHDFMNVLMVTHWMPLPDAPQEPAND